LYLFSTPPAAFVSTPLVKAQTAAKMEAAIPSAAERTKRNRQRQKSPNGGEE